MKTTITQNERLQIIGLMTLARKHQAIVQQCDYAMREIIEDEDDYGNLLSDAIYEASDVEKVLEDMKITVED